MDSKNLNRTTGGSESLGVNQPNSIPLVSSKSIISASSGSQKCAELSPGPEAPKIVSRNCNGTVVLTSSPKNEAELQLYRVMQRASLLAYYDTLLEMGGDDVQQLCDAGEEEFLEIMALVGMASKPLHVRRLQKALQEWMASPALFQTPLNSSMPVSPNNSLGSVRSLNSLSNLTPSIPTISFPITNSSPGLKEVQSENQIISTESSIQKDNTFRGPSPNPIIGTHGPGSPSQVTPILVETQISRLAETAETLVKTLPQFEPKPHNTKKKICRDLENVMKMSENDPRRMDEIRKYAAIYGRFDCKRNPQKPLTLHEVSVNEAAAQICRFAPALLTRRDDLFSLARQVVRDSGYNYIKGGHSSITPIFKSHSNSGQRIIDDNHSTKKLKIDTTAALPHSLCDNGDLEKSKRQERLEQIAEELRNLGEKTEELVQAAQQIRKTNDLSSIQTLQQQMEVVQNKQTQLLLEQSDLLKQPLPSRFYRRSNSRLLSNHIDSEKHDTDDTDSQFSLSNASSPSQEVGDPRDSLLRDGENFSNNSNSSSVKSPGKLGKQYLTDTLDDNGIRPHKGDFFFQDTKVQVISASGGNIIAVANPALSMSSVILQASESHGVNQDCPLSLLVENHNYENYKPD